MYLQSNNEYGYTDELVCENVCVHGKVCGLKLETTLASFTPIIAVCLTLTFKTNELYVSHIIVCLYIFPCCKVHGHTALEYVNI